MVSNRRGGGISPSVLRAAAIGGTDPSRAASLPDPVQALPDFLCRRCAQSRATRFGLSVWMCEGAPATRMEAPQCGVLRRQGRQAEEEPAEPAAKEQVEAGRGHAATATAARTATGGEDSFGAGELCAASGQQDRGATGEPGGGGGDAGQRKEPAQHGPAAASGSNNQGVT